jgi:hypothetical protein
MATSEEKDQTGVIKSLRGPITRRQAIKAGGIAVVGLAFSKPLIETVWPKPAFAQYVTVKGQGCTPGYWKQRHHLDSWMPTGFSPDQTVVSVFSAA